MITQIVEYLSFEFNLVKDFVVEGKNKIVMETLVHQGMNYVDGNTYTVMARNKSVLDLPSTGKVRISIKSNWLYQAGALFPDSTS